MPKMNTLVKPDGVLAFDADWIPALEIQRLLTLTKEGAGDATPQGIVVTDQAVRARVGGLTNSHTGEPMYFDVTIKVTRPAVNTAEQERCDKVAQARKEGKAERDAKADAATDRIIQTAKSTAIEVAKAIAPKPQEDPFSATLRELVTTNLRKALTAGSGQ